MNLYLTFVFENLTGQPLTFCMEQVALSNSPRGLRSLHRNTKHAVKTLQMRNSLLHTVTGLTERHFR